MKLRLVDVARKLREWSHNTFGDFAKEMRACQEQMRRLMDKVHTENVLAQMRAIDVRMDELEKREEVFRKKISRQDWLKHGDQNTKLFHAKTKQRLAQNAINHLKDAREREFHEEPDIAEILFQYFEELFRANDKIDIAPVIDKVQPVLSHRLKEMLVAPYYLEEIQHALKQMHLTKAPGPDGMCAIFYQKFWNIVGGDVENKILEILNNKGDTRSLNQTHIF